MKVLVTGANGNIGKLLRDRLSLSNSQIRWTDILPPQTPPFSQNDDFHICDLLDPAGLERLLEDIDSVVHLGGASLEDEWKPIIEKNVIGLTNLFDAAIKNRVKRVIYASSHHAVGFYPRSVKVDEHAEVRPDSRYGVSKAFGEAVGRLYSDKYGLEVICIRIGIYRERPYTQRMKHAWIGPKDMTELVRCCIENQSPPFTIVYGASKNPNLFWDMRSAHNLGYVSRESAEPFFAEIDTAQPVDNEGKVERHFQGGQFCEAEFEGSLQKLGIDVPE